MGLGFFEHIVKISIFLFYHDLMLSLFVATGQISINNICQRSINSKVKQKRENFDRNKNSSLIYLKSFQKVKWLLIGFTIAISF